MDAGGDVIAERVHGRFVGDTENHQMQVLRDDGLYRHLRFAQPNTIVYYFDLVTWPGHLAICGDAGDYVFARTADMFEFFRSKGKLSINPHYWSEKLVAPRGRDAALTFSAEKYRQLIVEWAKDLPSRVGGWMSPEEQQGLNAHIYNRLFFGPNDIHTAMEALNAFEYDGVRIEEAWEWDLREYRFDFLWCCWAIVWGIKQYDTRSSRGE